MLKYKIKVKSIKPFNIYFFLLTGAVASSKTYLESISKLARHAHQGTWGGSTDIGKYWISSWRTLTLEDDKNSPVTYSNSILLCRIII